jgi:hypothetical protein
VWCVPFTLPLHYWPGRSRVCTLPFTRPSSPTIVLTPANPRIAAPFAQMRQSASLRSEMIVWPFGFIFSICISKYYANDRFLGFGRLWRRGPVLMCTSQLRPAFEMNERRVLLATLPSICRHYCSLPSAHGMRPPSGDRSLGHNSYHGNNHEHESLTIYKGVSR